MRGFIVVSASLLALTSVATAEDDASEADECPAAFQGARVKATKLREGVSLEFKNTNRAQLQDMRDQLREVAQMIEQQSTLTQTASFDEAVEFPPVDLMVADIAQGARVTVRAARFRDIPALQEIAFGFAEFWKQSSCAAPMTAAR
jgi:hypothetical protein